MTPGARLAAAIEVFGRHRERSAGRRPTRSRPGAWRIASPARATAPPSPASSTTRCAARASSAFLMGAETPRAILLGMLKRERGLDADAIAQAVRRRRPCAARRLSDDERARLDAADTRRRARAWIAGDYPEWLDPHLARVFGEERAEEGAALSLARAARPARQHAQGRPRQGRRRCSPTSSRSRRAGRRWGLRMRARRRRQEPGDPCRAGLPQGHGRGAGRRLAARRAVVGAQARRAGGRSLRRRRRQDAGARGDDGEQGPDLRHRRRQAAAGADPRPARRARARATCRCARRNRSATRSPISPAAATWC